MASLEKLVLKLRKRKQEASKLRLKTERQLKELRSTEKRSSSGLVSLDRKIESERIVLKYPGRIPIIVEIRDSDNVIELDKNKYLVPESVTVSHFMFIIRKRINVKPENAIFMFFGNTLVPSSHLISDVYKNYKDEDGFLYSAISLENTFG